MKFGLYLCLSIILMFPLQSCQKNNPVFSIPKDHVGMFGYGSLMSKKFIEDGVLGENYTGPYLAAHLNGFKRSWTFTWPATLPFPADDGNYYKDYIMIDGDSIFPKNLLYLNIKQDNSSTINGVIYIVPEKDLPSYDEWELGYERIEVTQNITGYTIEGGPVFAYTALPEFTIQPTEDVAINIIEQTYHQIIEDAFDYWGEVFKDEYLQSTETANPDIIKSNQKLLWVNPPLDTLQQLRAVFTSKTSGQ